MEDLIPVINKLSDVMTSVGAGSKPQLDLPQIVVIGAQSTGKSSVLECLVGRGFLPRGSGIVTRRPLVLQLIHTSGSDPDYAMFLHKPGVRYTDFKKVEQEIIQDTERVTGKEKGISRVPINLKVYSNRVVDLTLVDLPGITRVPIGNQPDNIEELIRNMCLEYITQPNSIILAVTAGNTDISTSDAIQLARRVDPSGQRTLGVITKLDLMDHGTDAYDVLTGGAIPLKLGYIGVVSRGQRDIESGKSMEAALEDEKRFFRNHPRYSQIADRCGSQYLAKTLNQVLLRHIQRTLPDLKQRVSKMLGDARVEMAKYNNPLLDGSSTSSRSAMLLQLLNRFNDEFKESLEGSLDEKNTNAQNGLFGGAKLREIFEDQFGDVVTRIQPFANIGDDEINTLITNSAGSRNPLFIPENAFEALARRQISLLEEPAMECVDQVYNELKKLLEVLEEKSFPQYRNLSDAVQESVNGLLMINLEPTREMIHDLIQIELAHINAAHPDFIGGDRAMHQVLQRFKNSDAKHHRPAPPPKPAGNKAAAADAPRPAKAEAQEKPPERPPKSTPKEEQMTCPICNEVLRGSNSQINSHIDACLKKQQKLEKESQKPKKKSGWGWFSRSDDSDKEKQEKEKQEKLPVPEKIPQAAVAAAEAEESKTAVTALDNFEEELDDTRKDSAEDVDAAESIASVFAAGYARDPRFAVELIRVLLDSYFGIVKKNIRDTVPKTIMYFLIHQTAENLHSHLLQTLYSEDNLDKLLEESQEIMEKRETAKRNLDILERASRIISEIRDSSSF